MPPAKKAKAKAKSRAMPTWPIPVPKTIASNPERDVSRARLEVQEFHNESELKRKVHKILSSILSLVHWLVIFSIIIFWIAFMGIFIIIVIHLIEIDRVNWLDDLEVAKLQSVLFSGVLGGIITLLTQKIIVKRLQ